MNTSGVEPDPGAVYIVYSITALIIRKIELTTLCRESL